MGRPAGAQPFPQLGENRETGTSLEDFDLRYARAGHTLEGTIGAHRGKHDKLGISHVATGSDNDVDADDRGRTHFRPHLRRARAAGLRVHPLR